MDTISFDKLLLKTAFCCMASDGHIDKREVELIKSMSIASSLFADFKFEEEINVLVKQINSNGKEFIDHYFDWLRNSVLSEDQELVLIDFAIRIIKADEQIEYSEIKFFKIIRGKLKVDNETILARYPEIENFLEDDIITDSKLIRFKEQYFDSVKLPTFDLIQLNDK